VLSGRREAGWDATAFILIFSGTGSIRHCIGRGRVNEKPTRSRLHIGLGPTSGFNSYRLVGCLNVTGLFLYCS
jgi:hypothetical protein